MSTNDINVCIKQFFFADIIKEIILGFIDNRELIAIQLTHLNNGISDKEFNQLIDEHFNNIPVFDESKTVMIAAYLAYLVPERFDSDLVSVAARCDIEQAQQAIKIATENLDKIFPIVGSTKTD